MMMTKSVVQWYGMPTKDVSIFKLAKIITNFSFHYNFWHQFALIIGTQIRQYISIISIAKLDRKVYVAFFSVWEE